MAQEGSVLYGETFSCSICMDILKEPVIIPCGHSYCKTCINRFWDGEAEKRSYSCPQCREVFTPRPVLVKSTVLAEVVEKINESRQHDDPDVESYATSGDVACNFCSGRKLKAFKSCLVCLASYCQKHLQPHHESAAFKRHKLVDPSEKLQEKICSRHDEVMKMFCRTDQKFICYLCSVEEHKGHDVVSAAAEKTEKQRELQESRADVQKNIQDRKKDVDLLKHQVKTINVSADQTEDHSEQMFTEMIQLLQNRRSELKKEVRSKQQTEVRRVQELEEKMEQEIFDLKKRDAELQQISTIEDHVQFVLRYNSLSALSVSTHSSITHSSITHSSITHSSITHSSITHSSITHSSITHSCPENYFEEVTAAVSELRKHLDKVLMEDWTKVCHSVEREDVLQTPEQKIRAGFLKYSQEMTLDPNTAHDFLRLSEENRKITRMSENQDRPPHPDRFTGYYDQVLSRESVTGRSYWEVEWRGERGVYVGVSYKSISRSWGESSLGNNNKSWMLVCKTNKYRFYHNNIWTVVSGPPSSRIRVYVDHTAGVLSFYSVRDTMTLIHRVNTTFTEPLHIALFVWYDGDTAELCTL